MSGGNQPADGQSAISYGWKKFTENWGEIIVAVIIGFVIMAVFQAIVWFIVSAFAFGGGSCEISQTTGRISCDSGPGFFANFAAIGILNGVFWIASSILQLWIIQATLMIIRGERLEAKQVMSLEKLGPFLIAAILVGIMAGIGFILCFIPGLLVVFFTFFYGYFVIDKDMKAMDAITASFNLVKENAGPVAIFWLLSIVVLIVGAILCGVGLIVAWPVVIIATGYMYKRLQGEPVAA